MTGVSHAAIGAALGSLFDDPKKAFAAGILSHIVADALPHKDLPPKIEAPLLIAAMALIAKRYGINSTQFWGALGSVLPDFEHALALSGVIQMKHEIFPTHLNYGKWHGKQTNERLSQIALIFLCTLISERKVD